MRAVRIHSYGDASHLVTESVPIPVPSPTQVCIKVEAAGINFVDIYERSGLYKLESLPAIMGKEGAGVIVQVGNAVTEFNVGDRVCFAFVRGSYAEFVCAEPHQLARVPDGVELKMAAASILQGLTALCFSTDTYKVKKGDRVLITSGAGGLGSILIQICKMRGAYVLTTVSCHPKAQIARANGADEVMIYKEVDLVDHVGKRGKVDVVFDSVGMSTVMKTLQCLKIRGHLVLCGNASGPVPPIDPLDLMRAGSITLTRPSLQHYLMDVNDFRLKALELFDLVKNGLKISIEEFALENAKEAQEKLTQRESTGKLILRM